MQIKALVFKIAYLVVLLLALGAGGYFYFQYRSVSKNQGETEVKQLVTSVGKLMELPDGTPTVATVSDKTKLESQPFFQKAENGDKVLIYQDSGRAILYRPSVNKIIDVAPIQLNNNNNEPASSSVPTSSAAPTPSPISLTLYNGTDTPALTSRYEAGLKTKFSELSIVKKSLAAKIDYEKTLVVNISNKYPDMAKQLAAELSAEITSLPEGETPPNSDLLIIFGRDKL